MHSFNYIILSLSSGRDRFMTTLIKLYYVQIIHVFAVKVVINGSNQLTRHATRDMSFLLMSYAKAYSRNK